MIIFTYSLVVHDGTETADRPKYRGLLHATRTIIREDGVRGLFRVGPLITRGLYVLTKWCKLYLVGSQCKCGRCWIILGTLLLLVHKFDHNACCK